MSNRVRKHGIVIMAFVSAPLIYAGCLDFTTSPDELLYLTFERLPYPSIVAGDTLRDSTGAESRLEAAAVNARGDEIAGAPLRFFVVNDTSDVLEVDSTTGRVVSESAPPQTLRVIAAVGGLQSQTLPIIITKRPDSLSITFTGDTVGYSFADTTLNFSDAITAKVLHNDSTTFYSGVQGWVVRYTVSPPTDTVSASIVDDQNRRLRGVPTGLFHIDTTNADGTASRKVRIRPGPPLSTPLDSVAVVIEAKYKGAQVRGSPTLVWVHLRPRTGT